MTLVRETADSGTVQLLQLSASVPSALVAAPACAACVSAAFDPSAMRALQAVALELAKGLHICYGWRVKRVSWGSDSVLLESHSGERLQADAVICTLPLGVLKVCTDLPWTHVQRIACTDHLAALTCADAGAAAAKAGP